MRWVWPVEALQGLNTATVPSPSPAYTLPSWWLWRREGAGEWEKGSTNEREGGRGRYRQEGVREGGEDASGEPHPLKGIYTHYLMQWTADGSCRRVRLLRDLRLLPGE